MSYLDKNQEFQSAKDVINKIRVITTGYELVDFNPMEAIIEIDSIIEDYMDRVGKINKEANEQESFWRVKVLENRRW